MNLSRFSRENQLILRLCSRRRDSDDLTEFLNWKSISWDDFLKTVMEHGVAPLVLDALLRLPLPEAQRHRLQVLGKQEILSVIHDNRVFKTELNRIQEKLNAKKIDCIVLKGLCLNYSELRYMGDIDLMVKETDLISAINAVLEIDGYLYRKLSKSRFTTHPVYQHRLSEKEKRRIHDQIAWKNEFQVVDLERGILIEFHIRPFQLRGSFNRYVENLDQLLQNTSVFWQQKQYNKELGCYTLSHVHSLILMCLQNAIKRTPASNNFRLSILVDIDNLVETGISWRSLLKDTRRFQIAPFVYFSLDLSNRMLGTPIPQPVLQELKKQCTTRQLYVIRIHRKSLSSLRSRHIIYSKMYNMLSPFAFRGTIKEQLCWLFLIPVWVPSREKIGVIYRMRRDSPWITVASLINPIRWFYQHVKKILVE